MAAAFRHRTSRAQDPRLRTHVVLANMTRTGDGEWRTLDGEAILKTDRLAAGYLYEAHLRHELSLRLGVEWAQPVKGMEAGGVAAFESADADARRIEPRLDRHGQRSDDEVRTPPSQSSRPLVCVRRGKTLVWAELGSPSGSSGKGKPPGNPKPGTGNPAPGPGTQTIVWRDDSTTGVWTPSATPPACPAQPMMLAVPTDLSQVTSILYPGQVRGNGYKPHGGFVFDNAQNNAVTVMSSMGGYVTDAVRYLASGEVQYLFGHRQPRRGGWFVTATC